MRLRGSCSATGAKQGEAFMRKVRVEKAVGMMLAHDITKIVPGVFKGVGFKRGHLVREEDIGELLKLGKRFVYVDNTGDSRIHEEEAALRIAKAISGEGVHWTEPKEGKINLLSTHRGLLRINAKAISRINRMGDIIVSTLKDRFPCKVDQMVAATRIIPLTIPSRRIEKLEAMAQKTGPIVRVLPFRSMKVGAVVTGSEIARGLVQDGFDEHVGKKLKELGCQLVGKTLVEDDARRISEAILDLSSRGCDAILTTGGLSVDPDDRTRQGIRRTGARILFYGSPVLPGAMFLLAKLGKTFVLGLPACVFYHKTTMFDLVFVRLLAGEEVTRGDVAEMGHGGLCLNCETCRFPACSFGK